MEKRLLFLNDTILGALRNAGFRNDEHPRCQDFGGSSTEWMEVGGRFLQRVAIGPQ